MSSQPAEKAGCIITRHWKKTCSLILNANDQNEKSETIFLTFTQFPSVTTQNSTTIRVPKTYSVPGLVVTLELQTGIKLDWPEMSS